LIAFYIDFQVTQNESNDMNQLQSNMYSKIITQNTINQNFIKYMIRNLKYTY